MNDIWIMFMDIAKVLGIFFLPVLGWLLVNVLSHSKKITILEQRVNESILSRLENLEKHIHITDTKIDSIDKTTQENKILITQANFRFGEILEEIRKINK